MKAKLIPLLASSLLIALAGCVVTSVYPFYTAPDVMFDPVLVGVWVERDAGTERVAKDQWQFERAGDKAYRFTLKEGDKETVFDTRLFKLGGRSYLDGCPVERPGEFIPPHYLARVSVTTNAFTLAVLNHGWLRELLEKQPGAIRHIVVEQKPGDASSRRIVLTASTAELQTFVLKYADDKDAFGEKPAEMIRSTVSIPSAK